MLFFAFCFFMWKCFIKQLHFFTIINCESMFCNNKLCIHHEYEILIQLISYMFTPHLPSLNRAGTYILWRLLYSRASLLHKDKGCSNEIHFSRETYELVMML